MHALRGSAIPLNEFVSVSILLKCGPEGSFEGMVDPLIVVSPLASISRSDTIAALKELHETITSVVDSTATDKFTADLLKEYESHIADRTQVYRPRSAQGIGLHFRLIRGEAKSLTGLLSLLLPSSKGQIAASLSGILLTVGVAGHCAAMSSSPGESIEQRMDDCLNLMLRVRPTDQLSLKSYLSSLFLVDSELRTSNAMAESEKTLGGNDLEKTGKSSKGMRRMSALGGKSPLDDGGPPVKEEAPILHLTTGSSEAARLTTEALNILSVSENNTFLQKFVNTGQERKANLDLTGGKSRFRRKKSDAKDPDFDGFDYKGPKRDTPIRKVGTPATFISPDKNRPLSLAQPKKDSKSKPLAAPRGDSGPTRRMSSLATSGPTPHGNEPHLEESFSHHSGPWSPGGPRTPQIDNEMGSASQDVANATRVQVNVALNEDLSCSYKQSQLSSCSIEGVVQIQAKTSARSGFPFYLMFKDLSAHVLSVKENRKFADDVSESLTDSPEDELVDRKYAVAVPRGDNYYPVLTYSCIPELRPVPVRVQTRVKRDATQCRVALQISSNPNNEGSLTDLTIIMGVPPGIIGESLVTQPPGGVWNESKRSVIWVVSELGNGEKFQLQARFEVNDTEEDIGDDPQFPVLLRCQCLHSQLTDVELEVRDVPEVFPADIQTKIARRYRLSHREKA